MKRSCRPVVLLEVIIAFALVAMCILPLIYPHVFIFRSEKKFISTVELDHAVNLLFADRLQRLYQNEIAWQDIEGGKEMPVEMEWLEPFGYKEEIPFNGTYRFIKIKQKPHPPGEKNAFIFNLEFTFVPKPWLLLDQADKEEKITYGYKLAMEQNLK